MEDEEQGDVLEARLPMPPRVEAADVAKLEAWGERVLAGTTFGEVLA